MNMGQGDAFEGAKLALFLGDKLAVILRDDLPGLPFAGYWDLPGGGREDEECPWACAQRECLEELGLSVPDSAVQWRKRYAEADKTKWFFVAQLPESTAQKVIFGNEGQRWTLMSSEVFISHPKAVPAFQVRLQRYLDEKK